MEHLIVRDNRTNYATYFTALNNIISPMGVYFEPNNNTKTVYVFNSNRQLIGKIPFKQFIESVPSEFDIDDDRTFTIIFNKRTLTTSVSLLDKTKGKTMIRFKYNTGVYAPTSDDIAILYPPYVEVEDASIYMIDLNSEDKYYSIEYGRQSDELVFKRYDVSGYISMSRGEDKETKLSFYGADENRVRSISSEGDEEQHKMSSIFSLKEESFTVIYREKNLRNGYENTIDKSHDSKLRHFSNVKLINNANVRNFLDDIVEEYERRLPYSSDQNGILGGYLYNEYVTGEENTRTIANNFLEEVGLPVQNRGNQRNRNKGKKVVNQN